MTKNLSSNVLRISIQSAAMMAGLCDGSKLSDAELIMLCEKMCNRIIELEEELKDTKEILEATNNVMRMF